MFLISCSDKVNFTKTEFQLRLPFVLYAYFESILLLLLNKFGHGLHRRQDKREDQDPPERVQARTERVELHYVYAEHGQDMESVKHNNFNVILILLLIIFHLRMISIWKEYHIL